MLRGGARAWWEEGDSGPRWCPAGGPVSRILLLPGTPINVHAPPTLICLGRARDPDSSPALYPTQCPVVNPPLAFSLPSAKGGPRPQTPLTLTLGPGGRTGLALLAAPEPGRPQRGAEEGGSGRPAPMPHLSPPAPLATRPTPHGAARGAGTLRKAKCTYIGRAVRRAGAAPVRSAPLPAAAVPLGRPPSAAAGRGRRPASAGPLAARLSPFVSVLGAQPGVGRQGEWGSRRGTLALQAVEPPLSPLPRIFSIWAK